LACRRPDSKSRREALFMENFKKIPDCPVEMTLQHIGDKWKVLIIRDLLKRKFPSLAPKAYKWGTLYLYYRSVFKKKKYAPCSGISTKKCPGILLLWNACLAQKFYYHLCRFFRIGYNCGMKAAVKHTNFSSRLFGNCFIFFHQVPS
jgi:hypothetical protein